MGFLLDTCIWIDVEQGLLGPGDIASITKEKPVYLCPITLAELKLGVELAPPGIKQKRQAALNRLSTKPLLRIDEKTADIFGSVAAELKKSGRGYQFRVQDLWIASLAIQHQLILLTRNKKDFQDIPGLELACV